ncbi:hypothetical protein NL676_034490 [Syzygium grande]|nr:hypothetical protein NL676_034490 [Syzygium grande]
MGTKRDWLVSKWAAWREAIELSGTSKGEVECGGGCAEGLKTPCVGGRKLPLFERSRGREGERVCYRRRKDGERGSTDDHPYAESPIHVEDMVAVAETTLGLRPS